MDLTFSSKHGIVSRFTCVSICNIVILSVDMYIGVQLIYKVASSRCTAKGFRYLGVALVALVCPTRCHPRTAASQAPLPVRFPKARILERAAIPLHTHVCPGAASGKDSACQCWRSRDVGSIPRVGSKMATDSRFLTWKTAWAEEPAGYSPRGC